MVEEIEKLAGLGFTKDKIEVICELQPGDILVDPILNKAFLKGFYQLEMGHWEAVKSLAAKGSSPAQEMLKKRIDEVKTAMLNERDF